MGSINYGNEGEFLYERVEYIRSVISYRGDDAESLQNCFCKAIDNYLKLTLNQNIESEQLLKGNSNIKIGSILYYKAAIVAKQKG